MRKSLVTFAAILSFALPLAAHAYPFGGRIGQIIFCFNNAIYAAVGPPRGGPFIWTPSTRTYQYGPPRYVGQWLLGLAAPPYFCLVSRQPVIVWSGILMTMEGSSGGAAPMIANSLPPNTSLGPTTPINGTSGTGGTGSGGTGTGGTTSIGHVVVSEVFYQADAAHGGKVENQWIEIFNGSSATVDVSRWTILSAGTSQTIPSNTTIPAGGYIVFAGTASVRTIWTIPQNTPVIAFPSAFPGFISGGDHVYLQNTAGTRIDMMSWGTDKGGFDPSAPTVQLGHSLIRKTLSSDSNTATDWIETAAPNPGR